MTKGRLTLFEEKGKIVEMLLDDFDLAAEESDGQLSGGAEAEIERLIDIGGIIVVGKGVAACAESVVDPFGIFVAGAGLVELRDDTRIGLIVPGWQHTAIERGTIGFAIRCVKETAIASIDIGSG